MAEESKSASMDDERKCDREGCTNQGSFACVRCKTVRFCSADCQKASWSAHKQQCILYPPNQATLEEKARSDSFPGEDTVQKESLKKLTTKIIKNARWARGQTSDADRISLAVDVLLDATRALVAIHEKMKSHGGAFTNQEAWDAFSGVQNPAERYAPDSWKAVITSWNALIEFIPDNKEVAQFLCEADLMIQERGYRDLERLCGPTTTWSAMVAVRQEAKTRLKVTPEKLEPVLQAFRESLDELMEIGLANAPRGPTELMDFVNRLNLGSDDAFMSLGNEILTRFKSSSRLPEFVRVVVEQLTHHWHEAIQEEGVTRGITWVDVNTLKYPYDVFVQDQVGLFANITSATPHQDRTAIYYVFMEVKKRLRYCFEDAVDPNHELVSPEERNPQLIHASELTCRDIVLGGGMP